MTATVAYCMVKLPPIGTGHMLFAGRHGDPPGVDAVRKAVTTVVAGVVRGP